MQELQLECITDKEDETFLEIVQSLLNLSIAELKVCKYKINECGEKKEVCDIILSLCDFAINYKTEQIRNDFKNCI